MLIMTQNRKKLVNLDRTDEIYAIKIDGEITYYADTIMLGSYNDTPEHENQIERIAEVYGAINCYVMPKEENK